MVRDVGIAEELAQEALVAALEQWPKSGIPERPGAWLMASAKHRAIDLFRRNKLLERKHKELGYELEIEQETAQPDFDAALDDDIGDDLLRLVFTACHPVLSTEARIALTLRLLGGLTTDEIARAFLVPEPTVAQRIVRAKRTLSEKECAVRGSMGTNWRAAVFRACGCLPDLQRRLFSHRRRRLDAPPALRGSAAPRQDITELAREEPEVAWPRRPSWRSSVAFSGAHRLGRRAGASARSGPRTLGSAAHPPRPCRD
jgi:RNA polymerase sigma factor (sigma-70 family)